MILLLDNYDSFTWNLYHSMAKRGASVKVLRNDAITPQEILQMGVQSVVISPGPGRPKDAGITPQLFDALPASMPILGVCLGHQALCEHYGARLEIDQTPYHGKASPIIHEGQGLLQGISCPVSVGRYHSIRVKADTLPSCLELQAWTQDGQVMAVAHKHMPRFGLQFHPESILTPCGDDMVARFVRLCTAGGQHGG